jgi:hypothetical protein
MIARGLAILVAVALTPVVLSGCGSQAERSSANTPGDRTTQTISVPRTKAFDKPPRTAAAKAARRACTGHTPQQVRRAYAKKASNAASRAERKFLKAALARQAETSVPLAARLYSMTVPKSSRADAFVACAHVLFTKESSR